MTARAWRVVVLVLCLLIASSFAVSEVVRSTEGRLLAICLVGIAVLLKREIDRHEGVFTRLRKGRDARAAVAEELRALSARGWHVLNGWPRDDQHGDVDHAVRGRSCAFAIETKSYQWPSGADLSQAIRNAIWLRRQWGVWVDPVVCVDQPGLEPLERFVGQNSVWVVDRRVLCAWLLDEEATRQPMRRRVVSRAPLVY